MKKGVTPYKWYMDKFRFLRLKNKMDKEILDHEHDYESLSTKQKVQCFACGKELEYLLNEGNPKTITPLYDGIWFRSTGNYGSGVYDPMVFDEWIQIAICDECIIKRSNAISHIVIQRQETKYHYKNQTLQKTLEDEKQQ